MERGFTSFFNRFWQIDIYFDASTNDFIPWQFESCLMFFLSLVWNISLFEAHSMCFCSSMLYCSPPYDDDVVIGVPPPPHLIKITCSGEGTECTKCYAGGSQHHCILLCCTALYLSRSLYCTVSCKMCTCIPLEPFCVPLSCIALRVASQIHFISLHCKWQAARSLQCAVLHCIGLFWDALQLRIAFY